MAGKVLHREPGDGDPTPSLSSLSHAMGALGDGLRDDLTDPARGALHRAEEGDMPAGIATALLAMAGEGDALGKLLWEFEDIRNDHAPTGRRRGSCSPPAIPDLVGAVRGIGRRWAELASSVNKLLDGAEQDAAEREHALIELQAGRARVTEDGTAIVAIGAGPGGKKGKSGRGR